MSDKTVSIEVRLNAVGNLTETLAEAARNAQGLNQGLRTPASAINQGLRTPASAINQGLNTGARENDSLARLRKQVSEAQAGLQSGALPAQMAEEAKLRKELEGIRGLATDKAGLGGGNNKGLNRFIRPVARHALGAIGANVGGVGALVGPVLQLGIGAGAAAVAVWGVTEALGKYNQYLKNQQIGLEEISQQQQAARASLNASGSGQAGMVTRDRLRSVFNDEQGILFQQRLTAAEGNPAEQARLVRFQLGQAELRARNERTGLRHMQRTIDTGTGRGIFAPFNIDAAAEVHQRREGLRNWQERMARPGGVDMDAERTQLQLELLRTRTSMDPGRAQERLLRQRGVPENELAALVRPGGQMNPQIAQHQADTAIDRQFNNAMGQIAALRDIQRQGLNSLRTGAAQHVGGLNAGQSGDIGSLHQAIQAAAVAGEQKAWQDELISYCRQTAETLTRFDVTGIPSRGTVAIRVPEHGGH